MTKLIALILVVGCSSRDDQKPPAVDPWATPAATPTATIDPWAAPAASATSQAHPEPASPPPSTSTLAGAYQCQTLRYGTLVNGMYQTAYVASALGAFEVDADGTYRSASYPSKGNGRTRATSNTVTFENGPYAGYVAEVGSNSSGAYIRFGAKLSEPPAASMQFNEHVCYRKSK